MAVLVAMELLLSLLLGSLLMIIDSSILLFCQLAVLSAFLGPDQVATETLLAADPEVFPWVQKYQRSRETVSETDYEVSAIWKYVCMVLLTF